MKIIEIKEKLEKGTVTEDDRKEFVQPMVTNMFCNTSKASLLNFQVGNINKIPTKEKYFEELDKVMIMCIVMETSEAGKLVREAQKLTPLSLEDEIKQG